MLFKRNVCITYDSVEDIHGYTQVNAPLGAIMEESSIFIQFKDREEIQGKKSACIYIFVSWMKKHDYAVLIKTLKSKCSPNAFNEELLKDFEPDIEASQNDHS
jgi:hypothetical protein